MSAKDFRERWQTDAERLYPKMIASLENALDAEVEKRKRCPCGRDVFTSFPDTRSRLDAITKLSELGHGRPATQQLPDDANIDLDADLTSKPQAERDQLRRVVQGRLRRATSSAA
jgi:hypothetical protein